MPERQNTPYKSSYGQDLKTPLRWRNTPWVLLVGALLILFSSSVFSFASYDGCKSCHGKFEEGSYVSKKDGSNWRTDLMDGHDSFAPGKCDACHKDGSEGEVFLNVSVDNTLTMSCVGCHGRVEDVNNSCTGLGGGSQVHCGSGAGLRLQHESGVGAGTCNGCHDGDPTPVGENIAPFNYGKPGVTIADACDADGTESQFSTTGLDNDGDGLVDGNDPDCQTNTAPTQPGELFATVVTVNSATVSWGASTDADDDPISYLVEYRGNGSASWISAGSTSTTSRPLSGLDPDQPYDVRVTPSDTMDTGTARIAMNLFRTEALNSAPTRPGSLSASGITETSAVVSWGASTDADDDLISYLVEYTPNGGSSWISAGSTNNTSSPLTGLEPDQSYDVRITPTDGEDDGPSRLVRNLFQTVALNSPPTQPGPLLASAVSENSAVVSWGASTDADDDPISYLVEYRRNGDAPWTNAGSTNSTSQPLTGLDPAQSYDVRVTPSDSVDDGLTRTSLNLFETFATDEVVFSNGFE